MKWRWIIGSTLVVVGGCNTALFVTASLEATEQFELQRTSLTALMQKHDGAFRGDLRALGRMRIFAPRAGSRDAHALLSTKVPLRFEGDSGPLYAPFPEALEPVLNATSGFPTARHLSADVAAVDTSWMRELSSFDIWDPLADPRVTSMRRVSFRTMPMPNFVAGSRWATVRLLQGLSAGDVSTALTEVEELARLLASTELLIGSIVASTCMRLATSAAEHARAHGIETGGWQAPPDAALKAISRSAMLWLAYVDVHADPELAAAALAAPDARVGRCAALMESGLLLLALEPMVGGAYDEPIARIDAAIARSKGECRLTLLREAWSARGTQDQFATGVDAFCDPEDGSCVAMSVAANLPGFRDLQIETFLMSGVEQHFTKYEPEKQHR